MRETRKSAGLFGTGVPDRLMMEGTREDRRRSGWRVSHCPTSSVRESAITEMKVGQAKARK